MAATSDHQETTALDLGALLDAGDGATVTLVAGETRLLAHRAVLVAGSPVCAAMFSHDTLEASSGVVTIPDVEGPVLRQLLAYLYTRRVPQLPDMAAHLLAAADKYAVAALKDACEQQVTEQLCLENAAAAAVLAVRHSCYRLRQAAVAFVKDHTYEVMATLGWAEAVRSQPEDVVEFTRLLLEPPEETSAASTEGNTSAATPADSPVAATTDAAADDPTDAPADAHANGPADAPADDAPDDPADITANAPANAPIDTPADANANAARPNSNHGQGPDGATPPPAAANTPPPDDAAVSRLRNLSVEERGKRLIQAAKDGKQRELRELLAAGADVGTQDTEGFTPLHWAAYNGHVEAAQCLLLAGAGVNVRSNVLATPLHSAAGGGRAAVARLLVSASADLTARNAYGRTPLHSAVLFNHPEAATALLEAGADVTARDNEGRTVLDVARVNNHPLMCALQ